MSTSLVRLQAVAGAGGKAARVAHAVHRDDALEGMVHGRTVVSLCGRFFVPTRDGRLFPRCLSCLDVLNRAGLAPPGQ